MENGDLAGSQHAIRRHGVKWCSVATRRRVDNQSLTEHDTAQSLSELVVGTMAPVSRAETAPPAASGLLIVSSA